MIGDLLWTLVRFFLKEKRFLLIFGFVYVYSIISMMITANNNSESQIQADKQDVASRSVSRLQIQSHSHFKRQNSVRKPVYSNVDDKDIECKKLPRPRFLQKGVAPLTALSSFPGSGNTWIRFLLSSLSGVNTGDIYRDSSFAHTPGFSYRHDDTVIAVKTHHPFWDDSNGPDPQAPEGRYWERAIIIVRHPLDATISGYNFFTTKGSHTRTASLSMFLTLQGTPNNKWNKWAHDQIKNWGRCLRYWVIDFKGPVYIMFYENLKNNLEEELKTLMKFLNMPIDPLRLNCTLRSQRQTTFKRRSQVDKRLLYDSSMLDEAEKMLADTITLLKTSYQHINSKFSIPKSYDPKLIHEEYSPKPDEVIQTTRVT